MKGWFSLVLFLPIALGGFPSITPTKGRPWPLPHSERPREGFLRLRPDNFTFTASGYDCEILQEAFERYTGIIFPVLQNLSSKEEQTTVDSLLTEENNQFLKSLPVRLMSPCEHTPHLHMDEQYELKICPPHKPDEAILISQSIWGALRGLETFSQIVVEDSLSNFTVNCTQILDHPRFPHRGVMLDTSRHYLSVSKIKENLDLMAMNKFNVFHWHIVDDQSFPYQSDAYPELSAKGAWSPDHVYTREDISNIVDYARKLGIRVLVEFDTPGHVRSWGPGRPGLLTNCSNDNEPDRLFGPWTIDPSKEENYEFLRKLFEEIADRFPDNFVHIGGDEVNVRCWEENENIRRFMASLNIRDYSKLKEYYIMRLTNIISNLPSHKRQVVWQEIFDDGIQIPFQTIVHVWKYPQHSFLYDLKMAEITKAGHQVILSACWYLNYISYGVDWHKYYDCDPQGFRGSSEQKKLVLGGEACMWGEFVDESNLIPRTWPRAAPVAERLWSPKEKTMSAVEAASRLEEHRCRLLHRGYDIQPLGPSFCPKTT